MDACNITQEVCGTQPGFCAGGGSGVWVVYHILPLIVSWQMYCPVDGKASSTAENLFLVIFLPIERSESSCCPSVLCFSGYWHFPCDADVERRFNFSLDSTVYFYFICPSNVQPGIQAVKIGQKMIRLYGSNIRPSSHDRAKPAKDASVISTSIPADFLWNNLIYFFTSVQSWLPAVQAWSKARKTMITLILERTCQHYQNISNTSTSTILKS